MRKFLTGAFLVGVLLASQIGFATAPAGAASGATCFAQATVTISPGVSAKPSSGTVKSSGGKITCAGVLKGTPVGGTGAMSFSGTYGTGATKALQKGDTCEQGSGTVNITGTVKKAAGGSMKVSGTISFVRVGSSVLVSGKLGGANVGGTLGFFPKVGQTCATVKVTTATVAGQVAVGG
jgi:hypothetical protein